MLLRTNDNNQKNNFLLTLSLGKYGVLRTYLHLLIAIFFIIAVTFLASFANWNVWGMAIAIFVYGIYISNVGLGLWRVSRKINNEVGSFLTKFVAAASVLCGISAILKSLNLVFTLF